MSDWFAMVYLSKLIKKSTASPLICTAINPFVTLSASFVLLLVDLFAVWVWRHVFLDYER